MIECLGDEVEFVSIVFDHPEHLPPTLGTNIDDDIRHYYDIEIF